MVKRFIPIIYLLDGKAVRGIEDPTVVADDPHVLIDTYNECGADALIIYDLSYDDASHEYAIDTIKALCNKAECDVYGAGNIKRMEDVKKLLYAGCSKAILNYDIQSNVDITEEVSLKFGGEKILAMSGHSDKLVDQSELVEKYISEVILTDVSGIPLYEMTFETPFIASADQLNLGKILDLVALKKLSGISGNAISDNCREINNLKKLCVDSGYQVATMDAAIQWDELKLNSDGMVPVVVQDYRSLEVLMVAYMNQEAFEATLRTGKMVYYSRSRNELWLKGETSGHYQYVKSLSCDCDKDTILAKVSQVGAACHTGARSCFFNDIAHKDVKEQENPLHVFEDVFNVIKDRKVNPKEGSYTNYLFDKGIDKILKKVGEEATEIVIAAKNPNPNEIKYEISDFLYHCMVLMVEKGVTWEDITTELANR